MAIRLPYRQTDNASASHKKRSCSLMGVSRQAGQQLFADFKLNILGKRIPASDLQTFDNGSRHRTSNMLAMFFSRFIYPRGAEF